MRTTPIVALDVASTESALSIIDGLGASCRFFKVGAELFTAEGPNVVHAVRERGAAVFLDLKYHDIPNTVAGAVRSAARLGVRLLTVHTAGGRAMLRAAAEAADDSACEVLAVTLLTSLSESEAAKMWGRDTGLRAVDEVLRLAELAAAAGVAGVVCSAGEARSVKDRFGEALRVLIPGVRLRGGSTHDQARVSTPAEAASAGADYIVIGRTVTGASDRQAAMNEVLEQLRAAQERPGSLA